MEAPRDLFLTAEYRLCEAGSLEAAFLFHRQGQTITTQEEATYAVTAYLERTAREGERAERERIVAQAKAVEFAEVENKAVAEPPPSGGTAEKVLAAPADEPSPVAAQEHPIPPVPPESPEVRRTGGGRRG